jgi:hypothetical protein
MNQDAVLPPLLADLLHGLVPLHLMRLAACTEHARQEHIDRYIDGIASGADRVAAPGNFNDRRERAAALSALAGGLAAGALQPGGITWCGLHWCTRPHPECPTPRTQEG